VDAYDNWTLCQIQYNYVDEDFQAGTEGLKYAAERGLAIVVMEPLRGGVLAKPPKGVDSMWRDAGKDPVEISLQWLWDKPEVSVVISGMSTLEQVKQNVELAARSNNNRLTEADFKHIDDAKATFDSYKAIPCTQCRYCMPCPNGVDIPRNFQLYNQVKMYDALPPSKFAYNMILTAEERADNCIACLECEEKCPQQIAISQLMPEIHDELKKE
jgi:predicted aldo/keto reductase-like oxidoreductase